MADDSTRLTLLAPPDDEPLTLAEAKQFLRIDHVADDAVITQAITAARMAAEAFTRLLLLPQTYSYEVASLTPILSLPVGPARSIEEIIAYDDAGNGTEVSDATYRLTLDGYGVVFSHVPVGATFSIEFTASHAALPEAVPALLKQGMLHHIAAMLENRQGNVGLPPLSLQCYQPYRRVRL